MRVRTGFSFRKAVGSLDEVLARIKELGWPVAPISDECSTFGFVKWRDACAKADIAPAFGVELNVSADPTGKRPITDAWTFFAIKDSLRPLHDLVAMATGNGGREPCLTYRQALDFNGLKIIGERCQPDDLQKVSGWGYYTQNMYFSLSPSTPKGLANKMFGLGFSPIAQSDNVFPRADDREFYRVCLGKNANSQTYLQHLLDDQEWAVACQHIVAAPILAQALENRLHAFRNAFPGLKSASLLTPEKPLSLRAMCGDGAVDLKINLADPVYSTRLKRELEVIEGKNFENYFYIIADLISFAKKHMIVGPARGSSCGSLVCYLLGITMINPIPYKLLFERFIDETRSDLPDIDIDFSDVRREMVFKYAEEKYGLDHVARLGTVTCFKPRTALKQAGAGLRIPFWMIEKTLEALVERQPGDFRFSDCLEDTIQASPNGQKMLDEFPEVAIAYKMEGHPNNSGQHAAGIVITEAPIIEHVAIDARTKSTMCDKVDAEKLNLLKIDALGLTQLSIFERLLELIGKPFSYLYEIPLHDKAAFEVLNSGHFSGIFQFNGQAIQMLVRQVHVNEIEDLVAIVSLCRPGPAQNAQTWIDCKNGAKVFYPHPLFEPILKNTYGVITYQEQIMRIGREIAGMEWPDVNALRKAIGKKLGRGGMDVYGDKFKAGCLAKGITENVIDHVWNNMCDFGVYAFNMSHAVAYATISYWCCWLKSRYPIEFSAATLDAETDPNKQIKILRELHDEGIGYVAVDPEHSTDRWAIVDRGAGKILVGPLTAIRGIGPKTLMNILQCRKEGLPLSESLMKKLQTAKTEISDIYPIQTAIEKFAQRRGLVSTPTKIIKVQCGNKSDVTIAGIIISMSLKENKYGKYLSMFMRDDTDEIYIRVNAGNYLSKIIERGHAGKIIYAMAGHVPDTFRMLQADRVFFLGIIDGDNDEKG